MKVIAIDDEPPALKVIASFCKMVEFIELKGVFHKPSEAALFLKENTVDLIFLDIQMPSISGIDFFKTLEQDVLVIFTTAYSEYAVEGFNLSATDYLLKPFTYQRFLQAVNKAEEYYQYIRQMDKAEAQFLYIRADYSLMKVNIADILYIEGLDDYLKIHIHNQKTIVARMTLKAVLEKLPTQDFMRVHRSFIVPLKKIKALKNKSILIDNTEIPIGNSYSEAFFQQFKF